MHDDIKNDYKTENNQAEIGNEKTDGALEQIESNNINDVNDNVKQAEVDPDNSSIADGNEQKKMRRKDKRMRNAKKRNFAKRIVLTFIAAVFAISFLLPTILTLANSFMSSAEITTNYGVIFSKYKETEYGEKNTDYIAEKVNLKLIPDMVDFSQYGTVLLKSPDYLIKRKIYCIYFLRGVIVSRIMYIMYSKG